MRPQLDRPSALRSGSREAERSEGAGEAPGRSQPCRPCPSARVAPPPSLWPRQVEVYNVLELVLIGVSITSAGSAAVSSSDGSLFLAGGVRSGE